MRRNLKILLLIAFVWFFGVIHYISNSQEKEYRKVRNHNNHTSNSNHHQSDSSSSQNDSNSSRRRGQADSDYDPVNKNPKIVAPASDYDHDFNQMLDDDSLNKNFNHTSSKTSSSSKKLTTTSQGFDFF